MASKTNKPNMPFNFDRFNLIIKIKLGEFVVMSFSLKHFETTTFKWSNKWSKLGK